MGQTQQAVEMTFHCGDIHVQQVICENPTPPVQSEGWVFQEKMIEIHEEFALELRMGSTLIYQKAGDIPVDKRALLSLLKKVFTAIGGWVLIILKILNQNTLKGLLGTGSKLPYDLSYHCTINEEGVLQYTIQLGPSVFPEGKETFKGEYTIEG